MAMTNDSNTFSLIDTSRAIPLSIGVFFDGTNNNKFNSDARKTYEAYNNQGTTPAKTNADGSLTDDYKAYDAYKDNKGDDSYENDYSNVARMYKCTDNLKYSIYVQGSGSSSHKDVDKEGREHIVYGGDASRGGAWGTGSTGIRQHTQYACQEVAKKIAAAKKDADSNSNSQNTPPTLQVTIDVYGFSRGAATARNFVFEVHRKLKTKANDGSAIYGKDAGIASFNENADKQEYTEAKYNLGIMPSGYLGYYLNKKHNINWYTAQVEIVFRFAGLYDTVASYDNTWVISTDEFKNPYRLDLHRISEIMSNAHILHFTAQDEHREFFALTKLRITNAGMHKQIPFHGVHSDIGGSYEDIKPNNPDKLEKSIAFSYGTPTAPWKSSGAIDMAISLVTGGPIAGMLVKYGVLSWAHKQIATESVEEQKKYLLSQGWFKAGEMVQDGCDLVATRELIPKKYSYLFLYLMCKYISGAEYWKPENQAQAEQWKVTYKDAQREEPQPVIDFQKLKRDYNLEDSHTGVVLLGGGFRPDINNSVVFNARTVTYQLCSLPGSSFAITDIPLATQASDMQWHKELRNILEKLFYEQLHDAVNDQEVFHYANQHYNPDKVEQLQGLGRFQTIEDMMATVIKYPNTKVGFDAFRANLVAFNQLITEQVFLWALRHRYIHWNSNYNSTTVAGVLSVAYPYQPHWAGGVRIREKIQ